MQRTPPDSASLHPGYDFFTAIAQPKPEIVLFGTGTRLRFPSADIAADLLSAGIGFEVMDTAAACRSYVILLSEDRNVAAALLMIE